MPTLTIDAARYEILYGRAISAFEPYRPRPQSAPEEELLPIGRRKPKRLPSTEAQGGMRGSGRRSDTVDFTVPSTPARGPLGDGPRPYHFEMKAISRTSIVPDGGHGGRNQTGQISASSAHKHACYIEREGAAEQAGDAHATYIERSSAVAVQAIETEEADRIGKVRVDEIAAVYSNISSDPWERIQFWEAVERTERSAKHHDVIIDCARDPTWANRLVEAVYLPADFRTRLAKAIAKRDEFGSRSIKCLVASEDTDQVVRVARTISRSDNNMPLTVKHGRSGRVQYRFVMQLPEGLDAAERDEIMQLFLRTFSTLGAMFTAVIHAPDSRNDGRNFHAHVIAYDRPCKFLVNEGRWDFDVYEECLHGKAVRRSYPFRQKKIRQFSQSLVMVDNVRVPSGKAFPKHLKVVFADCVNSVLERRRAGYRYSAESYAALGIDRTPTDHLGTNAAAAEALGIVTATGIVNSNAVWADLKRTLERSIQLMRTHLLEASSVVAANRIRERLDKESSDAKLLNAKIESRNTLCASLLTRCGILQRLDLEEKQVRSRAEYTQRTCVAELGRQDLSARRRAFYQSRLSGAVKHLTKIDDAMRPFLNRRIELAEAEWRDVSRLNDIDKDLHLTSRAIAQQFTSLSAELLSRDHGLVPSVEFELNRKGNHELSLPTSVNITADSRPQATVTLPPAEGADTRPTTVFDKIETVQFSVETRVDEITPLATEIAAPDAKSRGQIGAKAAGSEEVKSGGEQERQSATIIPIAEIGGVTALDQPVIEVPSSEPNRHDGKAFLAGAPQEPSVPLHRRSSASDQTIIGDNRSETVVPSSAVAEGERLVPNKTADSAAKGTWAGNYTGAQEWDALIDRISVQRIEIVEDPSNLNCFIIPGLSQDDQALLSNPAFADRTKKRLRRIHGIQLMEKERLRRAIDAGESAKSKQAVTTLNRYWGGSVEGDRRLPVPLMPSAPMSPIENSGEKIRTGGVTSAAPQATEGSRNGLPVHQAGTIAGGPHIDAEAQIPAGKKERRIQAENDPAVGLLHRKAVGTQRRAGDHTGPTSQIRQQFDDVLAYVIAKGLDVDMELVRVLRPILTADPPVLVASKVGSAFKIRPLPGHDAPALHRLSELKNSGGGLALRDTFMPLLVALSPLPTEPEQEHDLSMDVLAAAKNKNGFRQR